jgi:serine/threonine protein kinase
MDDPLIGQFLGNYRIDSVIGRGGMATVYYGFDESLHRPVAVKVIDARYRDNPAYAERFIQEARSVATWRHDNILQVFYAGQQNDLYYFAMEFVDGPDLSHVMKGYIDDGELMPQDDVVKIGRAVADALDYAHQQNIIHRDVKPSNIMIAKDGRVVLADFGLALNSQQGSMGETFGTPHYISPEQARNSAMAVPQSDLYSLGIILYEMLTGSVPFDDPSPTTLAVQHLTMPPPPPRQLNPNLNKETGKVLLHALNKQPEDRYQTGADLMDALTEALTDSQTGDGAIALPPLPSGVVARSLSQTSVAERVSLYMPPPPPNIPAVTPQSNPSQPRELFKGVTAPEQSLPPSPVAAPPAPPTQTQAKKSPLIWIVAALVAVCLLGAMGWAVFGGGDDEVDEALVAEPEPSATVLMAEETLEADEQEQKIGLSDIEVEPVATDTLSVITVEPTGAIVETVVSPTEPVAGEPTSPPATEAPAEPPTAAPLGPRLVMLYDPTSFYVYNPNAEDKLRISEFTFESLDENGNPMAYWFAGRRWSQFYSFVESYSCMRLEMTKVSGWLRPAQCRSYNSTITPEQDGDIVFWTARDGVTQFRVMRQGEELGRCDVNADQCEVYLP